MRLLICLDRFLAVEEKFVGRADEDAATRELIKASSKKDAADVLLAHGKLKARSALARALVAAVPRVQALSGRATDEERARLERDLDRVAALEAAGPGLRDGFISGWHGSFETERPALREPSHP